MTVPITEKGHQNPAAGWWGSLDTDEDNPDLQWPRSVEVYDQMRRRDPQVISVWRAVTLPIRRTEWRIDPTGCSPEVAQHVADDLGLPVQGVEAARPLRTRDRFSWPDHLRLALLSLVFGHSFFEQVYRPMGPGQPHRLRKLAWRPPRTITEIGVASDGGLKHIKQAGLAGGKDVEIPVTQLVAYVNDREGGNWLGQSLLRPAYKDWRLKEDKQRTQHQMVARNGLGTPYYEASDQSQGGRLKDADEILRRQDEELEKGKEITRDARAGDEAGVAYPNGAKFGYRGVEGTLPDIDQPIRYHDEQIARAVLAHFLNLGTETGSWALGSTFADFFTLSLQTVATAIQDVTNQHVIEDLVDVNWGTSEPAPRLVFDEIGSRHPATADSVERLIRCGAIRPDDPLEIHMRTKHSLPAPDPTTRREPPKQGPGGTDDSGGTS